jgi:LPS-assembly lipoprotein
MRLRALLPAVIVAFAAPLAGCGFSPMYGGGGPGGGGPVIGPVTIDEVPGKAGFVFKAELEKLLSVERGGDPARRLTVALTETSGGLGFRVDESASRSDLTLYASYKLSDADGKTVVAGAASSVASYDVPASAFGEIASQDDARERAAENLAEKVRANLALLLARKKMQPPKAP